MAREADSPVPFFQTLLIRTGGRTGGVELWTLRQASLGEEEAKAETNRNNPWVKVPTGQRPKPEASLAWSRGDPGCEA